MYPPNTMGSHRPMKPGYGPGPGQMHPPGQMPPQGQMPPGQMPPQMVVVQPSSTAMLPFNVDSELNIYSKVYVAKEFDYFRIFHRCEWVMQDYIVYGELPDGDKKILFTVRQHFQCCKYCDDFSIPCLCCEYMCCNKIVFQMDYKRNNTNFYTQGFNIQKGCYCCKCNFCKCGCFPPSILFLRENIDADNPDFNVGVQKGQTVEQNCCGDRKVQYDTQEGLKGPAIKLQCCNICKHQCANCCTCGLCGCDVEMIIEDGNGSQTGTIEVPNGSCSKKVEGTCCLLPGRHYVVNFPPSSNSTEKFQIIADLIHFDLVNKIL